MNLFSGKFVVVLWMWNECLVVVGFKMILYVENVVVFVCVKVVGVVEVVFVNSCGELCECMGSNVFVVVDGVVFILFLELGLLCGIMWEFVIEWKLVLML